MSFDIILLIRLVSNRNQPRNNFLSKHPYDIKHLIKKLEKSHKKFMLRSLNMVFLNKCLTDSIMPKNINLNALNICVIGQEYLIRL